MRKLTRKRLEKFLAFHATKEKVLDVGSGGSAYGKFFPNRISVDVDPSRNPDMIADAHNLPFNDEEFEIIICTEVLEHVRDPQKVIDECYRVLKKGGKLLLTTRFVYPLHDAPNDLWRFTRPNLKFLFRKFSSTEITSESLEFSTIAILLQRIIFQTKVRGGRVTKAFLFIFVKIFNTLDWLVLIRYGDIKRTIIVSEILSSGYYIESLK